MAAVGAALVALAAASSASAFPVFTGGPPPDEWSNYEYQPHALTFEGTGGERMKCVGYFTRYQLASSTELNLELSGIGCLSGREPCFSGISEVGNTSFLLDGKLGYVNRAKRKLGLLFTGAEEAEGAPHSLARMFCGGWFEGSEMYPSGTVAAALTPANRVTKSLQVAFKQAHGVQAVAGLEEQPASMSMTVPFGSSEQMGIALKASLGVPGGISVSG